MKAQIDSTTVGMAPDPFIAHREQYPWARIAEELDSYGAAVLPKFLSADECRAIADLSADRTLSRTPPIVEQSAWGAGDHRYFHYPLPEPVERLRTTLYPRLALIANDWNGRMEIAERYPETHRQYLQACRSIGQILPTSMLIDHAAGQYSFLHQDLYGPLSFPLQVAVLLSQPGLDFSGGEFVITEQRPRMQTRPEVVTLDQGDLIVLAVSNRPVTGTRGTYRVNLRHGFSKVRSGRLRALSITFHDATA